MKVVVGATGRGQPERYAKDIAAALKSTRLKDTEFVYDLSDSNDIWTAEIEDCDAVLLLVTRGLTAQTLARARGLRFVQMLGVVDPHRLDVDACKRRGIVVSALPDAAHIAVAEHTLMFILCMARQTWRSHYAVVRGENPRRLEPILTTQAKRYTNWLGLSGHRCGPLSDKTLGLIGFGGIAQEVAKRACALGMRVVYTKRTRLSSQIEDRFGVSYCDLPALLSTADFVSLHASLEDDAAPIIGRAQLALMKSEAVLINTARGNQIDQPALIEFLASERIAGAALDVFTVEPVLQGEFAGLTNVILTPHTAGLMPPGRRLRDAVANLEAYTSNGRIAGLL